MRKAQSPAVRFWLTKMATFAIPHGELAIAKTASASQAGNDVPFEQAFSNLAHAYLRDSAPTLLDHEIGFQLLDRNEDNNKAIGVFGFRVGSSLLLAPVFFLNGTLKGHELLYLKNQDVFVPLQENWVNDILNKKPNIMGSGVGRNSSLLGMLTPDLSRLSNSPSLKQGSFAEEMAEAMPALARAATTDIDAEFKKLHANLHLPTFLKQAGLQMLGRLVETFQDYPEIGQSFDRFHGLGVINEAIKLAGARARTRSILTPVKEPLRIKTGSLLAEEAIPHPIKTGALQIMTYDSSSNPVRPAGISDEEAERLARDKLLIKDERKAEEVSVAYSLQVEQRLQNPSETGLFDVLVKPNKFEKCLVVVHGAGPDKRLGGCTVVRLDGGGKDWINCATAAVWVGKEYDKSEFKSWFESLSEPGTLSKDYTRYILIGPEGDATVPFRVRGELGLDENDKCYDVDFDTYVDRQFNTGGPRVSPEWSDDSYCSYRDGQRIHLDAKQGTKITSQRGDMYVPKGFKLLTVESSRYDLVRSSDSNDVDVSGPLDGASKKPPISPGNLVDVQMHMFTQNFKPHSEAEKTTKEAFELGTPKQLKVALANEFPLMSIKVDGPTVTVNERSLHHRDALVHLVRDHGFREKEARELMGRAQHRSAFSFHVKYGYAQQGNSPYLTDSSVGSPPYNEPQPESGNFMHDSARTRYSDTQISEVPGLQGWLTDPQVYNPNPKYDKPIGPQDAGTMQQAGGSDQTEVFDASAIGSMLKAVRDDTMIDRYMGPLAKGLDSLGRILFMFYWHGDRFAERFGKQDMPELEDALRNSFEGLGDVVIFLKQKSVEPYPEESSGEVDLAPIAGN